MKLALVSSCILAASAAFADGSTFVSGNVRFQALSPTVLRFEVRGPKGFEDRPTFRIPTRKGWSGDPSLRVYKLRSETVLVGNGWSVRMRRDARSLEDVAVKVGSQTFHPVESSANQWLPSVGNVPTTWSFSDRPRLVPSAEGALPTSAPNSGWDTGNDAPDVYLFITGGSYFGLRRDVLKLTGPTEMPPLFMLGYIDSRWYPYTEEEALARVDEFRRRDIPLDMLVMDTDWRIGASHGYAPNPKYLPDPARFFRRMHAKGAKVMFNDHPEPQAASALDPKELTYRWNGLSSLLRQGLDVWWYDRNWGVSLNSPMASLRHEVWGMQVYRDMTLAAKPNRRPVIMANTDGIDNGTRNRAPDIAAHKFPVQWTGDTGSTWKNLALAVENALVSGVEGLNPWVNDDLGGHVATPDRDLYVRFMQYGSLCPVMRPHCTYKLERAPWAFGPEAERIVRNYAQLRYRLMPLLYASARDSYDTGTPIVRRLDLDFPTYKEATRNDQFLVGSGLLVAPVLADSREMAIDQCLLRSPNGQAGLRADYFANAKLEGVPTITRIDPSANFRWGNGSPSPRIPSDRFSVRWTGRFGPVPPGATLQLATTADDGVRVWLDGELVIDRWLPQDSVTTVAAKELRPGHTYDLRVEYFEEGGGATCEVRAVRKGPTTAVRSAWIPPGTWTNLWSGRRIVGPRIEGTSASLGMMPMFVRDGTILPLAPKMSFTGQKPWRQITLEVFPGPKGTAQIYEDDGKTNAYKAGEFRRTRLEIDGTKLIILPAVGGFPGAPQKRSYVVRFHIGQRKLSRVLLDGKPLPVRRWYPSPAFPLMGMGPAAEGTVLEVRLPEDPVRRGYTVEAR